jgi:hypothetical protein
MPLGGGAWCVGPERLFDVRTLRLMSKADEVIAMIGHTLDVHKNGRSLNGQRLDGREPRDLTADKPLAHSRLPLAWHAQRTVLGFA